MATGSTTYGYGLHYMRLRAPLPTVPGSTTCGCSLPHLRLQVQERDVVMVIHEHGKMQLKELVANFKPLMGGEKGDKDQFMAIVKKVATLVKGSDPKVLVLNESTLEQYGLQAKS